MSTSSPPPAAAPPAPLAAFPALAHLLGEECWRRLVEAAAAAARATGAEPGAVVHGLLVKADAPRPEQVPGRLVADVAAVERAIEEVTAMAASVAAETRLGADAFAALDGADRERAVLMPSRALRVVPVAFRVAGFVRRLHRGGRRPTLPPREEQHVIVHALPALGELPPCAWWNGLPPGEGRLLATLSMGTPLGEATAAAVASGDVADGPAAHALVTGWLRDGLFTGWRREA